MLCYCQMAGMPADSWWYCLSYWSCGGVSTVDTCRCVSSRL